MERKEFERKYLQDLNPQQRQAAETAEGAVLLLAVPGSGKTTVLVRRLGWMVCVLGIDPRSILTMTYTTAATREMRERFASLFGDGYARAMEFRTINGVSSKIIQFYSKNVSQREPFALLEDEGAIHHLLRSICSEFSDEYPDDGRIKELRTAITYIKNMMLTDPEIEEMESEIEQLPAIYRRYCEELRRRGQMDYDDQMAYALTILRSYPAVLKYFREKFRYICVDEAQDTSKIQHAIIRLLTGEKGNLFMVGDEDQSIYGFRAAYPEALLHFETDYPGAQVLLMEENYRSVPAIVTAAGTFVSRCRFRHPKTMRAVQTGEERVECIRTSRREAQYQWLFAMGEECREETAILYRNNDSALPLIDYFQRRGIPYNCRRFEETFFTNRVVQDVQDILRFSLQPWDERLFMQIYYKLDLRLSKNLAAMACGQCLGSQKNILQILLELPGVKGYVRDAVQDTLLTMEQIRKDNGRNAVRRVWDDLHYSSYARTNKLDSGKRAILEMLGAGEPDAEGFLRRMQELREITGSHTNRQENRLTLSTIHSAKGMEFEIVYLLDVIDGVLPSVTEENAEEEEEIRTYEEERRLYYVAMTRAKRQLYLFTCGQPASFTAEVLRTLPVAVTDGEDILAPLTENLLGRVYHHREKGKGRVIGQCGGWMLLQWEDGSAERMDVAQLWKERAVCYAQTATGVSRQASARASTAAQAVLARIEPGSRIRHRLFGGGIVRKVEGDSVTIRFDNADTDKKFGLRLSLEKGYLSI